MSDRDNRKARLTQRLVNTYPEWADIRSDPQSNGFQFFNAIGASFDDLVKRLDDSLAGFHLATTPPSDLGLAYRVKLPRNYTFSKEDNDDTESNYVAPTTSGYVNNTYYAVSTVEDNNLSNFWRDAVPDRISLNQTISNSFLTDTTIVNDIVANTPFVPAVMSGIIGVPNKLYIRTSGGTSYIALDGTNKFQQGMVQIDGKTRSGLELTEEIPFIHDDMMFTLNDYVSVSGIRAYGISPSGTQITVDSMNFNAGPYRSAYDIDYAETGEDYPTFWDISSGISTGTAILDFIAYDHADQEIRLAGFPGRHSVVSQRIVNTAGSNIRVVDMKVQPNSDHLWVLSNRSLYCYRSELPYFVLTSLKKRAADPACQIIVSSDYIQLEEEITVEFYWRVPTKGLLRHRVLVEHSSGTKYGVLDGALDPYSASTDYFIYGEPYNRWLQQRLVTALPSSGQYTISLEAVFVDDTTETSKRVVVCDPTLSPLGEYSLTTAGVTQPAVGIDIDSEDNIWVKDSEGLLHKIDRHYDNMLIDFDKKIMYFRENYDEVIIE
jgi:hypothetical protein